MEKGEITVYLALVMAVLLSLILALIEGARISSMKLQIEYAVDCGLNSAFAEYHRELLNQYDLFFIDTSYGSGEASIANTEQHIKEYMEYNLNTSKGMGGRSVKDWMNLKAEEIAVVEESLASDEGGAVCKRQIVRYMKNKIGLEGLETLIEQSGKALKLQKQEEEVSGKREEAEAEWEEVKEKKQEEENVEAVPEWNHPFDSINAERRSGILSLVVEDMSKVSAKTIQLQEYISHREAALGTGMPQEHSLEEGAVEEYLLGEYLLEKCGSYRKDLDKARCKYQLEYILNGKGTDMDNLRETANKLLLLREVSNLLHLWSDSAKMSEADVWATAITALIALPELQPLVKQTILFAWATAESMGDIKKLLSGGKIPLLKQKEDWNISFENLFDFKKHLDEDNGRDNGLDYEEYLRIFIFLMNKQDKMDRFMDLVEMDIRETAGNERFRMDACLDSLLAEICISSGFGYTYKFRRFYCYE